METKPCSKCFTIKPLEDFAFKNKATGRRNAVCKACHKIYRDNHYRNNKRKNVRRTSKRRETLREWVNTYKKERSCACCSESFYRCLEFHHLNPDEKDLAVADAINNGWSIKRIQKEIDKCILVCANCHVKIHAGLISISAIMSDFQSEEERAALS